MRRRREKELSARRDVIARIERERQDKRSATPSGFGRSISAANYRLVPLQRSTRCVRMVFAQEQQAAFFGLRRSGQFHFPAGNDLDLALFRVCNETASRSKAKISEMESEGRRPIKEILVFVPAQPGSTQRFDYDGALVYQRDVALPRYGGHQRRDRRVEKKNMPRGADQAREARLRIFQL